MALLDIQCPPEAIKHLVHLQPLPTCAFTLENFSFPDSEVTNQEITEIVKDTIHANPKYFNAEVAIHTIESVRVASLTLAHSKSTKETVWNVYFKSPPNFTLKQYFDWTSLLHSFFYISEDYSYGTACHDVQFMCIGCKSFNHPTGLCPFPKILGWFSPSATEDTNAPSITVLCSPMVVEHPIATTAEEEASLEATHAVYHMVEDGKNYQTMQ
ncbi:hypothetical protein BDR07DRAFT_1371787 [Suillus spraguei]|nr:hypothetical protein BDR07DRAFT_1371787 [Suillus spraguei]